MTAVARGKQGDAAVGMIGMETGPAGRSGLVRALRNTGVSVFYQDRDLKLIWAQNTPAIWADKAEVGSTDLDFLPPDIAGRVIAAKQSVLSTETPQRLEINVPDSNGSRWFDLWIDADRSKAGKVRGVVTTAVETTEHKHREQTLRALLREVSHRSKNLLAIIQSIATQTGRYSGTIDVFLTRFRGRIQSLASSQDLVTSSNWRGAGLHALVVGQVGRYAPAATNAIRFEGDRPWLNPNAALHVGLALHELAVNSVSFGALSKPEGFVNVDAHISNNPPGQTSLSLRWTESLRASSVPDAGTRERRFGSVALERVVPAALNGAANLAITAENLEYTLVIPFSNFEVD